MQTEKERNSSDEEQVPMGRKVPNGRKRPKWGINAKMEMRI